MSLDERTPEERERARLERERRRQGGGADEARGPMPSPGPANSPASRAAPPTERQTPSAKNSRRRTPPSPSATSSHGEPEHDEILHPTTPPRRPPTGRRRIAALVALAVAVIVPIWSINALFQPFAGDGRGHGQVRVEIPRGADVGAIGRLLADNHVVASGRIFSLRAGWSGKSGEFQAGRYSFGRDMGYAAAIDLLAEGPNAKVTTVTVIEGRSRKETARQVAQLGLTGDYLAESRSSRLLNPVSFGAPKSVEDLEGFLFPATYELAARVSSRQLVKQQLTAFRRSIRRVDMSYARRKNLTVFDVVTIASLIEREVQVASERRLVAAVIYNRLKQGIPLGIDATSRFETDNWSEPLTNAVLTSDTPYNTRTRRGLPPGPIGSPGLASLRAAARPANVGYLFYVADPCKPGAHAFSTTDAEFQRDVERYKRARDAAGGRQPDGC